MYRPVLVTPPSLYPVTLAEAKAQCRAAQFTDDDVKIQGLIAAATSYLDGWPGILGRALCEQTWRQDFDSFSFRQLRMPLFPVLSIVSINYRDTAGSQQTIDPSNYSLQNDDLGAYAQFLSTFAWPSLYIELPRVSVTYKAGHANAGTDPDFTTTVPDAIKHAMLMLVAHWYDTRETILVGQRAAAVSVPMATEALLAPFRRVKF